MSAKKGGKNTKETSKYEVGERVLAKLRGFPPWPALVRRLSRQHRWLLC